ncbi:glycosyltransferase [Salegentibacter maritimus]|uniref:Glycosyltransferase n=1 Tax=Salegentibacter maritimus TaxID=2794347 RepID=A0ABS0TBY3_9FLAO|nr:glycosyltransferase [Salegentibacter maritimus]MBI6118549.1 glycosyltransferase [Salegentibacter maritimus]
MSDIELSIITPCYNQAEYLEDSLGSILNQEYKKWECIIVDDGSTDNTRKVVKKWLIIDKRFKYIYQSNAGVCNARNKGIYAAKGKFILPLDADDKISKEYTYKAMQIFKGNPEQRLVYCLAEKFGISSGLWELPPFSLRGLAERNMIFNSAIFKKDDWRRVGGYDNKMVNGLEDWEFWISILKDGGKVEQLKHVGCYYRIKEISRNSKLNKDNTIELYRYLSYKHSKFFIDFLGSFHHLIYKIEDMEKDFEAKLSSEKFVIDVFLKNKFGFTVFGKI